MITDFYYTVKAMRDCHHSVTVGNSEKCFILRFAVFLILLIPYFLKGRIVKIGRCGALDPELRELSRVA